MSIRSGQAITTTFTTRRYDTGAAANGDSTPSAVIYVNGTADAGSVTISNIATGLYKAAATLPTLAFGDTVSMVVSATVNAISYKEKVWEDTKDIALDSSGIASVDAVKISGDTTAADNAERFFDGTGYGPLLAASTVATVNSQTSLTLNVTNLDQSHVGATVIIRDVSGVSLDEAIVGAITAVSAGEQVDFTVNGTAGFTIAAGDRVEILTPGASAKRIWDELKSGHRTSGTFGYYLDSRISTVGSATVNATYVDAPHTWTFQNSTQLTSPKIISEYIGFNGLLCLDLNSVLPPEVAISSIGTVAFANISGTEPTVGTATVSTNLRKVLIPVDATSATANRYTLSVTVTSTDSQTITRKGQFDVS